MRVGLNLDKIKRVVVKVKYKDWIFYVGKMGKGFYIQCRFKERDAFTNLFKEQHGRKWYVSPHSTEDEIVRTCFLAVITASEHEIREFFLYKNKRIFGPHISISKLMQASKFTVKRKN